MNETTSRALPPATPSGTSEQPIPSISFEALLVRRAAAVERLQTIAQAVKEYRELGETIWKDDADGPGTCAPYKYREPIEQRPSGNGTDLTSEDWLEHSIAAVDAALWDHLLTRSGLRSFLDAKARKEWHEQIEKHQTPPLTPENVRSTFASMHEHRAEYFERGVVGVFRALSWDYKTNLPQRFGKRLIMRNLMSQYGGPRSGDGLDDLARVLHMLDGKPEPDHRSGWTHRLWDLHHQGIGEISDPYMRIRVYGNGNGHVTFLRLDLVDQLNRIIAKHFPNALPPASDPVKKGDNCALSTL